MTNYQYEDKKTNNLVKQVVGWASAASLRAGSK